MLPFNKKIKEQKKETERLLVEQKIHFAMRALLMDLFYRRLISKDVLVEEMEGINIKAEALSYSDAVI